MSFSRRFMICVSLLVSMFVLAGCSMVGGSGDSKKIEELTKQVQILNKAIIVGADGTGRFATATPVPIAEYKEYGFGLPVPSNVRITASGVASKDATKDSGSILAASGGTSLMLVWNKATPPLTPQESVIGAFNVLESITQAKFEVAGAGQGLSVDNQPGSYGTFVTRGANKDVEGVGIIGGWNCPNDKRSYAITVTGKDLAPVQQSFVYLTNGFHCEAGKTQAAAVATPTPIPTRP